MSDKKYCLELTFTQSTEGEADNETLMREFSKDPIIHAIKTQVMTKHITQCLNAMTKEFTDLAIANGGTTLPTPEPDAPGNSGKK